MVSSATTVASYDRSRTRRIWLFDVVTLSPLIWAAFFSGLNRWRVSADVTLADLGLLAAVGVLPLRAGLSRGSMRMPMILFLPAVPIVAGALLLSLFNQDWLSMVHLAYYLIASVAVPLTIFLSVSDSPRAQLIIGSAWVLGIVFSSLVGIFAHHHIWFFGLQDPWAHWRGAGYRISGLAQHPNLLAIYIAMTASFVVAAGVAARKRYYRAMAVASYAILFYALDLTGSRAALGAMMLVTPVLFLFCLERLSMQQRIKLILLGMVAGFVVVLLMKGMSGVYDTESAFGRLFGGEETAGSDYKRSVIHDTAIADFLASPILGVGYDQIQFAHNFFLQFMQSGGVFGLIGFLLYNLILLHWMRMAIVRFPADSTYKLMAYGLAASVISWFFVGFYQNVLVGRGVYIPIGLLIAFAYNRQGFARQSVLSR